MRILVCVISCFKNKHKWTNYLKKNIDDLIIVCADENLDQLYKLDNKILYLKCNDSYGGLCEKIIYMINTILELEIFKTVTNVLKVDDDNCFSKKTIINLYKCQSTLHKYNYIGQQINTQINPKWHFNRLDKQNFWYNKPLYVPPIPYCDGGESYILSRYSLKKIQEYYNFNDLEKIRRENIWEDYMISSILLNYNIKPRHSYYFINGDKNKNIKGLLINNPTIK